MKVLLSVLAVGMLAAGMVKAADDASRITIDIGNAFTFGKFTYDDATIDIDSEMFNPRGSIEFKFGGAPLAVGAEYLSSQNTFTGEYDDTEGESGNGTLDLERSEFAVYLKLVPAYNFNIRLGYRNFEYDITAAVIDRYKNGILDKNELNATANAKLSTGLDAQMNLIIGSPTSVNLALMLGYTYFIDGDYEWQYDEIKGSAVTHRTGTATANAHSIRLRPELSLPLTENLRIYAAAEAALTAWDAEIGDDDPDYPGYDFFMGATAGLRYGFDLQ